MANKFEANYLGPKTESNPFEEKNPFEGSGDSSVNPFESVGSDPAAVPNGPTIVATPSSPEIPTVPQGTYWSGVAKRAKEVLGVDHPEADKELADIESEYEASDKGVWARLRKHAKSEQVGRKYMKAPPSPLEVVAKPLGKALELGQKYIGHPAATAIMKAQLGGFGGEFTPAHSAPRAMPTTEEWAQMSAAQKEQVLGAPEYTGQKPADPQTKEFNERMKGLPLAGDVKPPKGVVPSAAEIEWRRFLSAIGGDSMKLDEESEAIGRAQNMDLGSVSLPWVGDFEIAKLVTGATEMGGELPFYVVGNTGIGARVTNKGLAAVEGMSGASAKQLAKATAKAHAHGAGAELAAQSTVLASKNNEDVHTAAVEGYVAGRVLSALWNAASGSAKKEVLASVNKQRAAYNEGYGAAVLPPLTWEEFVKETARSANPQKVGVTVRHGEALKKQIKAGPQYTAVEKPGAIPVETKPNVPQLAPEPMTGSDAAKYTYKTIERGRGGEKREVRYLVNAKTGRTKKVYSETLAPKHYNEYRRTGSPVATDGEVYAEFLDDFFAREQSRPNYREGWGKEGYKSPEEAAALIDKGMIKPQAEYKAPTSRDNTPTKAERTPPQLLEVAKNGDVAATPIIDRKPDTQALSPRHVMEGDIVHVGDELAVVDSIVGDEIALVNQNGRRLKASQAEVALADEDLINLADMFGPLKSAQGKSPNLLALKRLDIKRVMNATGDSNPVNALRMLKEMEAAGQIEVSRPGEWKPNKSYKPEALTERPELGDKIVYYDTTADAMGKAGVLRGRDPKRPGNYLVEVGIEPNIGPATQNTAGRAQQLGVQQHEIFNQTNLKSVPMDNVRPYTPVLNGQNSAIPQQYGISVPMPADAVITNEAAAKAVADYSRMSGQLTKILSKTEQVKKGMERLINHDAWLVPTELRKQATQLAAQPGMVKAQTESYQNTLSERLGGELSVNDQWLSNIALRRSTRAGKPLSDQEKGLMRFFANNPQMNQEVRQTVETALRRLKDNQDILARLGVTNIADQEAMRAMGLEDEYIMNVYMKYLTSRKDFASFVKKQMPSEWDAAVKEISKRHGNEAYAQTEARMLDILGLDIDSLAKQAAKNPSGDVAKKLKERIQMADEIARLIGKVDSASVQIAHSLASTDSLITRIKVWNDLSTTPYWSPGPRTDLGPHGGIPVPNSPVYGAAAGGRMHESFRFLLEARQPHIESRSMLRSFASMWKFNQVVGGGFAPWVNQVMRNWKGFIVSGGLQGPEDFKTFFDAAEQMLKYRANSILSKGSFYEQLMQNGGVGTGFAGSEINKDKVARRIFDAVKKSKGKTGDYWELMANIAPAVKGTAEEVGAAYDAIDRLFKLTAGMNNYRRCIARGMSPDDAMAYTVMRNNQSFVNFEMVSPHVEKMRQGSVAAVAPFLSSKAEDLRINATTLMRLFNEPDLQARLLAASGVVAAGAALMREQRKANGITNDMVRRGLDSKKLSSQALRPASFIWPEVDSEGRLQEVDLTQWEDLLIMTQMHERDNPAAAILRNNLNQLWGEETMQGALTDMMMNKAFGVVPLAPTQQLMERPGEQSVMQGLAELAVQGGIPQGPIKAYRNYMKGQPPRTIKEMIEVEQWTPEQVSVKNMGLPFAGPIGNKTAVGRARELKTNTGQMESQIRQSIMNKPQEDWGNLLDPKIKALQEMIREYQESKK